MHHRVVIAMILSIQQCLCSHVIVARCGHMWRWRCTRCRYVADIVDMEMVAWCRLYWSAVCYGGYSFFRKAPAKIKIKSCSVSIIHKKKDFKTVISLKIFDPTYVIGMLIVDYFITNNNINKITYNLSKYMYYLSKLN